jgi:hypothetical protein
MHTMLFHLLLPPLLLSTIPHTMQQEQILAEEILSEIIKLLIRSPKSISSGDTTYTS